MPDCDGPQNAIHAFLLSALRILAIAALRLAMLMIELKPDGVNVHSIGRFTPCSQYQSTIRFILDFPFASRICIPSVSAPYHPSLRREKEERRTLEILSSGGTAKSPYGNKNMKVRRVDYPRSAQSYFASILKISGFPESYYTLLRTSRRWHTPVCAAVLYRSPFFQRWRSSARLTTERYVKEQIPQFPAEHCGLYQIAAPVIKRGDLGTNGWELTVVQGVHPSASLR